MEHSVYLLKDNLLNMKLKELQAVSASFDAVTVLGKVIIFFREG